MYHFKVVGKSLWIEHDSKYKPSYHLVINHLNPHLLLGIATKLTKKLNRRTTIPSFNYVVNLFDNYTKKKIKEL